MEGTNADARPFFDQLAAACRQQAGATLDVQITVPVMVFFVIAQRRLTDGLVAGAVEG